MWNKRTENREQRTENREQRTENREQRTENRRTEEQWVQIKILNLLPESWDSMIGRSKTL
jgi:hypothetical protein